MFIEASTTTPHHHQPPHANAASHDDDENIREIHALTPPPPYHPRRRETWETSSHTTTESENFSTMSREFNALVIAGNDIDVNEHNEPIINNLERIREEEETNPLAIVADNNPTVASLARHGGGDGGGGGSTAVERVKKEEVESKISAWQNAKIAKINNRFKRDDAIINGWESEQVQKSTSWMKKVEVLKV